MLKPHELRRALLAGVNWAVCPSAPWNCDRVPKEGAEGSVHSYPGRGVRESCPGAQDVAMCSSRGR